MKTYSTEAYIVAFVISHTFWWLVIVISVWQYFSELPDFLYTFTRSSDTVILRLALFFLPTLFWVSFVRKRLAWKIPKFVPQNSVNLAVVIAYCVVSFAALSLLGVSI
jgi:hypothetical protein